MQFADPAWQPQGRYGADHEQEFPAPQPVWSPARGVDEVTRNSETPPFKAERDYNQGYGAQYAQASQGATSFHNQQQPPSQSPQLWYNRLPIWAWWLIGALVFSSIVESVTSEGGPAGSFLGITLCVVLLCVGWLLYTRRLQMNLSGEAQAVETRTFTVGASPKIVIHNKAGSIRLRGGQDGSVGITTTRRGYLFHPRLNNDTQIWYHHDNTTNTVSAGVDRWHLFGRNAVDFDIVVPAQANIELTTNAGTITVQDIAGQVKLRADAGSITANQVELRGQSRLKTDAGTITFDGSLDASGDYELITNLGSITVTLPSNASFNLEAKTDLGTVSTNLPLTQQRLTKAYGQVGHGPYPRLKAATDLGTVSIYQH